MLHRPVTFGLAAVRLPESYAGLMQIDEHTQTFGGYLAQGAGDHLLAIALGGSENVAIDALGMHPHQHVLLAGDFAANQSEVGLSATFTRVFAGVSDGAKRTVLGFEEPLA